MTIANVELRRASHTNIQRLLPLVAAYHAFEDIDSTPRAREAAIHTFLGDEHAGAAWLIYAEEVLAGYIILCRGFSIEFGGYDAFIDEFFVLPEYRGVGVGRRTLELVRAEASKLGIAALHLEVARTNSSGRAFYRDVGFVERERYVLMSTKTNDND